MRLFLLLTVGLFCLLPEKVQPAEKILHYEWNSGPQYSGGKTKTCFLSVDIITEKLLALTMNFAMLAELTPSNKVRSVSSLKVVAMESINTKQPRKIGIHYAWIRSSTGSTVGKIKTTKLETELNYLGAGPYELFLDILSGIVKDGVVIGYQQRAGSFDKIFEIPEPPRVELIQKLNSCLKELAKDASRR